MKLISSISLTLVAILILKRMIVVQPLFFFFSPRNIKQLIGKLIPFSENVTLLLEDLTQDKPHQLKDKQKEKKI